MRITGVTETTSKSASTAGLLASPEAWLAFTAMLEMSSLTEFKMVKSVKSTCCEPTAWQDRPDMPLYLQNLKVSQI